MTANDTPNAALEAFVSILESLGIRYFVGGAVASSIRGQFRTTNDIDIICKIEPRQVKPLVEKLGGHFLLDEVAIEAAVRERRPFNIIHEPSFLKLDIFSNIEAFQRSELERATTVAIPGGSRSVFVASAEDVILSKLVWFKRGNEVSGQQWSDVIAVTRANRGKLDLNYLKQWAADLDVRALLDRLLELIS